MILSQTDGRAATGQSHDAGDPAAYLFAIVQETNARICRRPFRG